ncbi:MAG: prepilin-type N-terminal cleavage/methylation domain-containing protein [Myxococcota bacterium]
MAAKVQPRRPGSARWATLGRHRDRQRQRQGGFTLVELMIALLISSLLVGMVFAIYMRLSVAYRGQEGVSELQQTVRAAKELMARDIRAAGHLMPQGAYVSTTVGSNLSLPVPAPPSGKYILEAVNWRNNVDGLGPDRIRVYYGDASAMARITAVSSFEQVVVDDADEFQVGDLALVVRSPTTVVNDSDWATDASVPAAKLVQYRACVVEITGIAGTTFDFASGSSNYNDSSNSHCDPDDGSMIIDTDSMIYRFVARAYRIDPTPANRELGLLLVSPHGEMMGAVVTDPADYDLLGYGFTNLQFAVRAWHPTDPGDGDADEENDGTLPDYDDNDPLRDWYSGSVPVPDGGEITSVTMSVEVRSTRDLNVVPSAASGHFQSGSNDDHNQIGDFEAEPLSGVPDASRPARYRGNHIYRWSTVRVDLRNTGIGR